MDFNVSNNEDDPNGRYAKDRYGIKRRREALKWADGTMWTQDDVAAIAGGNCNKQDVGQLERGERTDKSGYFESIMQALEDGENGVAVRPDKGARRSPRAQPATWKDWLQGGDRTAIGPRKPMFPPLRGKTKKIDIPIYRMQPKGRNMRIGLAFERVALPRLLEHVQDAYAVEVWGSGMAPKYHPRDIVVVNPDAPPRPLDGVLVMTEDREDIHIGQYVGETADEWIIEQFGSTPGEKRLSRADYPIAHSIVMVSTNLITI